MDVTISMFDSKRQFETHRKHDFKWLIMSSPDDLNEVLIYFRTEDDDTVEDFIRALAKLTTKEVTIGEVETATPGSTGGDDSGGNTEG